MVTSIGTNPENNSEMLVFNLAIDPDELSALAEGDLAARLAERPKPVRGMRTNAAPIVLSYEDAPDDLRGAAPDFDQLRQRATRIRNGCSTPLRLRIKPPASNWLLAPGPVRVNNHRAPT